MCGSHISTTPMYGWLPYIGVLVLDGWHPSIALLFKTKQEDYHPNAWVVVHPMHWGGDPQIVVIVVLFFILWS